MMCRSSVALDLKGVLSGSLYFGWGMLCLSRNMTVLLKLKIS